MDTPHLIRKLVVFLAICSQCQYLVLSLPTVEQTWVYSALCAVAKNENRYVSEWVKYHRCLGTFLGGHDVRTLVL